MQDILLITPPFTQLNTPYPATAYLKGFLNTKEISSYQADLGIEVILAIFSEAGLQRVFEVGEQSVQTPNSEHIGMLKDRYLATIDPVISFLQGKQQTLARLICSTDFLPQASRFEVLDDMEWAFGEMGLQDKAKHLATLYLEDLSDYIKDCVDPHFGFSRYAERLGRSANSFDELYEELLLEPSFIDDYAIALLEEILLEVEPKLVCFSVPFPGNLYSAFRCAQHIQATRPEAKIAMGGGFPNTELRSITDIRVFEFFDFITLDDGELPIELLYSNVINPSPSNPNFNFYKRTFLIENGEVIYNDLSLRKDYKQLDVGTPDYADLLLDQYISVIEIANPMHSLWSDGRWNKLTMAHGCYWGKCTFCDVSLDYIGKYEPLTAKVLVDRMETIIEQTGETGFHFVDEAAPPSLMKAVALEILKRGVVVSWWTNIRFEKSFTADLCRLLKASGCIAVSGGLEVATDRLLDLIQKGVTVQQVAEVTRNFTASHIMVHAYLMYGYPTQTIQETVDSLEMVRQLFEQRIILSGFWHQFALTAHSPVGLDPDAYHILPEYNEITFANNDVQFKDKTGIDHSIFSQGLKKSLFNYMHGMCFDYDLQEWFDFDIPDTTVDPQYITQCLSVDHMAIPSLNHKALWLGPSPIIEEYEENGETHLDLIIYSNIKRHSIDIGPRFGKLIVEIAELTSLNTDDLVSFKTIKQLVEDAGIDFSTFWNAEGVILVRQNNLLFV